MLDYACKRWLCSHYERAQHPIVLFPGRVNCTNHMGSKSFLFCFGPLPRAVPPQSEQLYMGICATCHSSSTFITIMCWQESFAYGDCGSECGDDGKSFKAEGVKELRSS